MVAVVVRFERGVERRRRRRRKEKKTGGRLQEAEWMNDG
jgi:hypothetical protein